METKLIKIGNSFGVRIPKALIQQYQLLNNIELAPTSDGILISSKKNARAGWQEQLISAVGIGHIPDDELLEGFADDTTDKEWQW